MKTKYLYVLYLLLSCMACLFLYFNLHALTIVFRWFGLVVIGVIYFKKAIFNSVLFYLSLVFAGVGETYIVLDFLVFFKELCVALIIYWWLLIFLLKRSINDIEYKIKKEYVIPIIVSSLLIGFFVYSILEIVTPMIKGQIIYGYVYVVSLLLFFSYLGILYVSKHNKRYSWLLFLLIALVITNVISSLEGLYYHNTLLEVLSCAIQLATHFIILEFLTSTDENILYID